MPKIPTYPLIDALADADLLIAEDTSASTTKKTTLTKLREWLVSAAAWITTSQIADAAVTPIKWANPYKFSAFSVANQSLSTGFHKVVLGSEVFDTNNNFATSRYTAPVTGYYQVHAQAWWGASGCGTNEYVIIVIRKNGATNEFESQRENGSGTADKFTRPSISTIIPLTAGDYIELYVSIQGGARDLVAGAGLTYMNGYLVSQT